MKKVKELIRKMEPEDRSEFLEAVRDYGSVELSIHPGFHNIRDVIYGAFLWENTDQGRAYWQQMAEKYKSKNQ